LTVDDPDSPGEQPPRDQEGKKAPLGECGERGTPRRPGDGGGVGEERIRHGGPCFRQIFPASLPALSASIVTREDFSVNRVPRSGASSSLPNGDGSERSRIGVEWRGVVNSEQGNAGDRQDRGRS